MIEFVSNCPDNDKSKDAELVRYIEAMTPADRKQAREKGEPCMRGRADDAVLGHVFAKSPGWIAIILDEHDYIVVLSPADFAEAWEAA